MKRSLIFFIIAMFTFGLCFAQNKDEKSFMIEIDKAEKLWSKGKYQECLDFLDIIEKTFKGREIVFAKFRFNVYKKINQYDRSVKWGIKWDSLDKHKSPNRALNIAKLYIILKKPNKALYWLDKSAERGFQNYYIFDLFDFYDPLKKYSSFNKIINKMKKKIGIGKAVTNFTTVDIDGKTIDLNKMKNKVILIDFWATWCKPCVRAFPNLIELYKKYNKIGFEIIGISLDKNKKKIDSFLSKSPLPWKIIYSGKGWDDPIKKKFGIQNIPSVWLVDKKGILRYFQIRDKDLEIKIKKLLDE